MRLTISIIKFILLIILIKKKFGKIKFISGVEYHYRKLKFNEFTCLPMKFYNYHHTTECHLCCDEVRCTVNLDSKIATNL